jgi:GNAT superfamily N-acetyltransferase
VIEYTHHCRVSLCSGELDALVKGYFATTIAKEGTPPLDMNWPLYEAMQETGALLLVTATHVDEIVGFGTYFIFYHPHHKTVACAQSDILAVKLRKRGKAIGKNIVMYAENELRELGVQIVTHQFRTCYDVEPLFPKLGYKLEEHSYRKVL